MFVMYNHVGFIIRPLRLKRVCPVPTGMQRQGNGQWSMPVRHKASPFWAQAVKKICTLVSHAISNFSHIWQKVYESSKSAFQ